MHRPLMVPLVLGLLACNGRSASPVDGSSDATPDLPPKSQWTPCPPTLQSASEQPCVGANSCDYGGCALPGDWCYCEEGKWQCAMSACPGPDIGPEAAPPDVGPDAALLGQGDPCDPSSDQCGAGLRCCLTCCGVPWIFDAAGPPTHTCVAPLSDGSCPPPPP